MESCDLSKINQDVLDNLDWLKKLEQEIQENQGFCHKIENREKIILVKHRCLNIRSSLLRQNSIVESRLTKSLWTKKQKTLTIATLGLSYVIIRRKHKKRLLKLIQLRNFLTNTSIKLETEIIPLINQLLTKLD